MTPALYAETELDKFASVAILVKADADYHTLENLRGRKVCMPEFGGIASVAFLNNLKANNLIDNSECNLGKLMADHFSDSCIPGARDTLHDPQGTVPESLCNLCRTSVGPAVIENADVLPDEPVDGRNLGEGADDVPADADDPAADEPKAMSQIQLWDDHMLGLALEPRNLRGSCDASITNRYFGNAGALLCLEEVGEVAVLEAQYLNSN